MTSPMLNVIGEKYLPARCKRGTVTYCPTMDLVAVVTVLILPGDDGRTGERLSVWRLNGQQVFGWDAPAGTVIQFVRWKMNGRMIALGTGDGVVRLLSVMNGGKVVHCLNPLSPESAFQHGLSCLAWVVNFGDVEDMRGLLVGEKKSSTLDDLLSLAAGKDAMDKVKADLPRELACGIEVESSFPKLSLLPPGTGIGAGWGHGGAGGE